MTGSIPDELGELGEPPDAGPLIVRESDVGGIAYVLSAFGLTTFVAGGGTFAHELGHNMGLLHDRYRVHHYEKRGEITSGVRLRESTWACRGHRAGTARARRWATIMAYPTQCGDADTSCRELFRFSNPSQSYDGDPLGVPFGSGGSGVSGPADAAGVLNATGPAVALWRDHVARQNRSPVAVGALPDRRLGVGGMAEVDVSSAFVDPDIGRRADLHGVVLGAASGHGAHLGLAGDVDGGG